MDDLSEFQELKVEEVEGEECQEKDSSLPKKRESILQEARVYRNFLKEHPEYKNDREIVLEAVKVNGYSLEHANIEFRNDREIVLQAVIKDGHSLHFASEELRNDFEIVYEAVINIGSSIEYASIELRNDRYILLEAVKDYTSSLKYASLELRNDREFVLETVKENACCLEYASIELRNDRVFVIEAVRESGGSLEYASEELRSDREFVLEAVKENGWSLKYASEEFRNDREIVLEAVKENGGALEYASDELRNDREILLESVKDLTSSLKYASLELRNDREFVLEVVKKDGWSFYYASIELRNDREIVLEAVKQKGRSLEYASEELRNDREIVLEAVKENGGALEYASDELRNDREFVLEVVKKDGWSFYYASIELRNDREIVLDAVKVNGWSLEYASDELRNDREFVLEAVKQDGRSLEYASEELQNDREFVLEAVKVNGKSLKYASEEFRNDADFLLKVLLKVRGMDCFRFMSKSVLKKHSILRLGKKFEGDLEKVFEEYTSGNVEKDEFFEEIFEVKLRNGIDRNEDLPFAVTTISEENIAEGEEFEIQELQEKLSNVGFNDLEILRFLGRGAYGGTYLCTIKGEEGLFVAKFNDPLLSKNKMMELVKRDSLDLPYHKNVVSILSHKDRELVDLEKFPDFEEYWKPITTHISPKIVVGMILMKYHRTSLSDLVGKSKFVFGTIADMFNSFHRILEGVHHLHKNFIVHRDLHPGNIFVYPREGRLWIGDFGCALDLRENGNQKSKFVVHKDHEIMFCMTGSSNYFMKHGAEKYTAPEILNFDRTMQEDYLNYEKSDLYSFGILLKWVAERTFPEIYESVVYSYIEFFEGLLADDPNDRIGFDEAFGQMGRLISGKKSGEEILSHSKTKTDLDEFDFEVTGVSVENNENNDDSEKRDDGDDFLSDIDFMNYDFSGDAQNESQEKSERELNQDVTENVFQF